MYHPVPAHLRVVISQFVMVIPRALRARIEKGTNIILQVDK